MRAFVFSLTVVIFVVVSVPAQSAAEMKAAGDAERAAALAYKSRSLFSFLKEMEIADRNRPNHPRIIYNLAAAFARNSRPTDALTTIGRLAKMGLAYSVEKDKDFAELRPRAEFLSLLREFEKNRTTLGGSVRSFSLEDKELIAESIAYDGSSKSFFVGSVHQKKILRISKEGIAQDFSKPEDGLWSVLGMKVDQKRGVLWAASAAFPQMKGFSEEMKGRSGVFKYDLTSGRLLGKYLLPSGKNHGLGEVLIADDGGVFATDSVSPAIYRIAPGKETIEPFIRSDLFVSLQGIAFGKNENEIYVADYSKGIFRIDAKTKAITQLRPANDVTLLGIDGLYYNNGRLIAIQNGVNPNRVISFAIRGDTIPAFKTLEAGHADFMEPTLGVLIGKQFHYIANSQWPLANDKGELALEKLRKPVVLKLDLEKALKN